MSQQETSLLGRLAIRYDLMTMEQLTHATRLQSERGGRQRLGEILVEQGYLDQASLDNLLEVQQKQLAKERPAPPPPDPIPLPASAFDVSMDLVNPNQEPEPDPYAEPRYEQPQQYGRHAGPPQRPEPGVALGRVPIERHEEPPPPPVRSQYEEPRHPEPRRPEPRHYEPPPQQPPPQQTRQPQPQTGSPPVETTPPVIPPSQPPDSINRQQLDGILSHAVQMRASDIHFHSGTVVHVRLNGELTPITDTAHSAQETEILLMSGLAPDQQRVFEEKNQIDFCYSIPNVGRYRANMYRQQHGIDCVFRLVPARPPTFEDLQLPSILAKFTTYHQGMILMTGPAGCGKSATMAAMINIINEERREHILTIEDPIEVLHPSKRSLVNQRQVGGHTRSFARALKGALREDPDVIAVGELRDLETISLALSAAETGHLVFATLHTDDSIRTIDRMIGVFPPSQQSQVRTMLSESLRGIVSQRLVRTADGRGRVPAVEILLVNKAVGNMIRDGRTYQLRDVLQTGASSGMCLLDASLAELVRNGTVERDEAIRHASDPKRIGAARA